MCAPHNHASGTVACIVCSAVTETIRTGIAKLEAFSDSPDVLAYGMLCALLASGIWLLVATFWELPVSTTHSIGARTDWLCSE